MDWTRRNLNLTSGNFGARPITSQWLKIVVDVVDVKANSERPTQLNSNGS